MKDDQDEEIEGTFYSQELQKVYKNETNIYRVEKVLDEKGGKLLVKWKGYPDSTNSWIKKKPI